MKYAFLPVLLLMAGMLWAQQPLKIKFIHGVNGNPVQLDEVFSLEDGRKIKLTRAEFYLCSLNAENQDGTAGQLFDDVYLLVNINNQDTVYEVGNIPPDMECKVLKMKVGVDSLRNHADPSLYPPEHPLALKDPSMHWGWQGGYRFMAIEGLMDADGDGMVDVDFQFHNLGDELLYTTTLDLSSLQDINTNPLVIALDYRKLFTGVNMSSSVIQHGSGAKNKLMLRNATQNGFFKPLQTSASDDLIGTGSEVRVVYDGAGVVLEAKNSGQAIRSVCIYNLAGQQVKMIDGINDSRLTLQNPDFDPGMYLASVLLENNRRVTKKITLR
jgi:hypothetical protein